MTTVKRRLVALLVVFGTLGVFMVAAARPEAATAPHIPAGMTAIALDGKTVLAWPAATGADSYIVYRGASAGAITTPISPAGLTATSFTDTTAANGTQYFYAVRAVASDATQSEPSVAASATPVAAACSTGNAIARENCFPGSASWKVTNGTPAYPDGIEGFVSASSVNAGDSVALRVKTGWDVPYRVEIYRTGWYGGTQGRLLGTINGLSGEYPPPCSSDFLPTQSGLVDCSGWNVVTNISTTTDWVSGVYLLKLVREDNGRVNEIPLVVREDGSDADVAYHVPMSSFQAYNRYGGKALYSGLSDPPNVITGAMRAAKVSFDRPYTQPAGNHTATDYYTRTDVATVGWLERQGYDVTYLASQDFDTGGSRLQNHKVFISGSHDEYWSQGMYDAAVAARDAGTSLIFMGANAVYWKIRFEASPETGQAGRVMVAYKTIESGPVDPSGISTSTWRDPAGANQPENALIGQMYVGENLGRNFPLFVSAAQGKHRLWRYTTLASQAQGATASVGTDLVGWEWDSTVGNGQQPAGLQTVAATPVDGNLIQANGASVSYGSATQKSTLYTAASGASVFATGTNNWWRGLGLNVFGNGEPNSRIQQATANVLGDMGAAPTTPDGVTADAVGPPVVSSTTPSDGGSGVTLTSSISLTFDRELDPTTVDDADLTLTDFEDEPVPGTVTWDGATQRLTFDPTDTLESFAGYTAHLGTGLTGWNGEPLAAPVEFSFTTGPGTPPVITGRAPAASAVAVPSDGVVTAHTDRHLDAATVNSSTFSLRRTSTGVLVPAAVSYNDATRTMSLTPDARLAENASYTVTATTGIQARGDGTPMVAEDSWSFTTNQNLKVSSTWPSFLASGISPQAAVRATFSRPVSAAGVTTSTFRLAQTDGGTPVAAHVTFDALDRTATLTPDATLLPLTSYTATVSDLHALDGAPVDTTSWNFTTASSPPPAPELTGVFPLDAAVGVAPGTSVRASFDIPLDPATLTGQNFTVTPDGGTPIAATISYDAAARKAILAPLAGLSPNTHFTATLTTGVRSTTGAPIPTTRTWTFTTANCPCNLMSNISPQWSGPVQDDRPGPGPFSYELGTKIEVTGASELVALRYYKGPAETGTHVGRVWNSAGAQIASVTFANETAFGWQRQALSSPVTLQTGQRYTISVGFNTAYVRTYEGLTSQRVSGPLRSVADGLNGVYAPTAGQFPTSSWRSSNYFVDGVVRLPGEPASGPQVTTRTPLSGATGVPRSTSVTAAFNVRLDPSTINATTFTVTGPDGAVPATVTYDDDEMTATLTPNAILDTGATYTAHLNAAIKSEAEVSMSANVNWSFTTTMPVAPVVTQTSPVSDATQLSPETNITATFDQAMASGTLNASTFTLTGPGGASVPASVSYDPVTRTATLNPSGDLQSLTAYTATLSGGIESGAGLALEPHVWTFTTSGCPCSLFGASPLSPSYTNLSTANGRAGGPWSLEMGLKIQVAQPARLEKVRLYKETGETGTHTGRVWSGDGTLIGVVEFTNETASGWQEATLESPLALTPGQTYVVSVGINSAFGMTANVFGSQLSTGPLQSVADGHNGVFADAAGAFPTQSWANSSYGIDATVR